MRYISLRTDHISATIVGCACAGLWLALTACAPDGQSNSGYAVLDPATASVGVSPKEFMARVGCTPIAPGPGHKGVVAFPAVGGGLARFDCQGADREAVHAAIKAYRVAARTGFRGAAIVTPDYTLEADVSWQVCSDWTFVGSIEIDGYATETRTVTIYGVDYEVGPGPVYVEEYQAPTCYTVTEYGIHFDNPANYSLTNDHNVYSGGGGGVVPTTRVDSTFVRDTCASHDPVGALNHKPMIDSIIANLTESINAATEIPYYITYRRSRGFAFHRTPYFADSTDNCQVVTKAIISSDSIVAYGHPHLYADGAHHAPCRISGDTVPVADAQSGGGSRKDWNGVAISGYPLYTTDPVYMYLLPTSLTYATRSSNTNIWVRPSSGGCPAS